MLPADLAEAVADLLAPPNQSPYDYPAVGNREVTEMAFLLGWLPDDRDRPRFLPVAVPVGPR